MKQSLHINGELRGCIGMVDADRALSEVVARCAVGASCEDPRFPPLTLSELDGLRIEISALSHPVEIEIPQEIAVSVDRNVLIQVQGANRQQVGQFAADVRGIRPPEPYKGKGIRYADERVRRKVGKAGAAAG